MLGPLIEHHWDQARCYCFDVPFDETLVLMGSEVARQSDLVNQRSSEALSWT